jgi:hypothetical protein
MSKKGSFKQGRYFIDCQPPLPPTPTSTAFTDYEKPLDRIELK